MAGGIDPGVSGRMKPACWPDVRRLWRVLEVSIGYVSVLRLQKHAKGQEVGEGRASRMSTKCSPSLSKAAFSGHRVSLPLSDTLISFFGGKKSLEVAMSALGASGGICV